VPPPDSASLPRILATARAGAVGEAWRLFRAAGLEGELADPATLAVKGRLLKAQAGALAEGAGRTALLAQAAEAYGAAGALSGASYHLINAATLWRLADQAEAGRACAERVLDGLARHPEEAETPYWREATRAEALLLLGRRDAAARALADAVAGGPRAWEDHAVTLRQFRLICAAEGAPTAWLEVLTPPRAAHFAGRMPPIDEAALRGRVEALLAETRIGFAFGAAAAGADIVIAEAMADAGVELTLVLPVDAVAFRRASVAGAGGDWPARFDALIERAVAVQAVEPELAAPDQLSMSLASEIAMGEAVRRAMALETDAVQVLALDPADAAPGIAGGTAWARARWAASGRAQVLLPAVRASGADAVAQAPAGTRLAAVLAVAVAPQDTAAAVRALGADAASPPVWTGHALRVAFDHPDAAAGAAQRLRAALGEAVRIGGAYGRLSAQPVEGVAGAVESGPALDLAFAILPGAPPGAAHLDAAMAAAACLSATPPRLELAGEIGGTEVFALGLPS